MSDVWLSSTMKREREREDREHKRREGSGEMSCGGAQRLTGQIYTQLMDNMPLLHHNAPISADP